MKMDKYTMQQIILIICSRCKVIVLVLPHNKAGDDWLTVCVDWPSALYPSVFQPSSILLCGSGTKSEAQTTHVKYIYISQLNHTHTHTQIQRKTYFVTT